MPDPKPDPPFFVPTREEFRSYPAQYTRNPYWRGWYQDGRKLRNVKPAKAFIWPKDGRNGSFRGRIKDIFKNDGPDIYVAFGARKADCVANRPRRPQWAGHYDLNEQDRPFSLNSAKFSPWTRDGMLGGRDKSKCYDFRAREYAKRHRNMWTDALWQPEPYKNGEWNSYPTAMRDWDGQWYQDAQYLPQRYFGNVSNEFGRGRPGMELPSPPWVQ